ncbi:MAG TPA: HAMP domain-containing sensor histidine kinase, partial [Bacteroidia bacterium]|nr:HAMP domain-containing sensor histidine kinase [Bacteroidia bacterium]
HEFRTPLGTLLSSLSILEKYVKPGSGSAEEKHINRIRSSVSHLVEILDDFLSLDKLENGKAEIQPVPFNVESFIGSVVEEMQTLLKEGQKIEWNYKGEAEFRLDTRVLKNILYNLLSNAIKFSGKGSGITIHASATEHALMIRVKDKGIGIPEADQPFMFMRLFRAKNAINIGGTGLGLNIVKRYIELMNGEIGFISEEGKGAEFIVQLPLDK